MFLWQLQLFDVTHFNCIDLTEFYISPQKTLLLILILQNKIKEREEYLCEKYILTKDFNETNRALEAEKTKLFKYSVPACLPASFKFVFTAIASLKNC